jgi:hypothetical protein
MRNDFNLPAVSRNFYEAFLIDDVSRGSKRAEELLLKHEDDELVLIVLYCFG